MITISNLNAPHADLKVTYGDEITARKGEIVSLAVAYSQFMDAATAGRLFDAKKWAERLDACQKSTGVELIHDRTLRDYL